MDDLKFILNMLLLGILAIPGGIVTALGAITIVLCVLAVMILSLVIGAVTIVLLLPALIYFMVM